MKLYFCPCCCVGFLQLQHKASHCGGFSVEEHRFWGAQASVAGLLGSRAQAQQLWCI